MLLTGDRQTFSQSPCSSTNPYTFSGTPVAMIPMGAPSMNISKEPLNSGTRMIPTLVPICMWQREREGGGGVRKREREERERKRESAWKLCFNTKPFLQTYRNFLEVVFMKRLHHFSIDNDRFWHHHPSFGVHTLHGVLGVHCTDVRRAVCVSVWMRVGVVSTMRLYSMCNVSVFVCEYMCHYIWECTCVWPWSQCQLTVWLFLVDVHLW